MPWYFSVAHLADDYTPDNYVEKLISRILAAMNQTNKCSGKTRMQTRLRLFFITEVIHFEEVGNSKLLTDPKIITVKERKEKKPIFASERRFRAQVFRVIKPPML